MSADTKELLFAEDQSFRQAWVWVVMVSVLFILVVIFALIIFNGLDKDEVRRALSGIGVGIVTTAGVAVFLYLLKLSVRVDGSGLHVRFFPLVKKEIPLDEIARWEARTYRPILEYGGWGIRCSWGKGMAYNVSGNRGVQLEFTNGKRLLIGSQRPEELAEAISKAKGQG